MYKIISGGCGVCAHKCLMLVRPLTEYLGFPGSPFVLSPNNIFGMPMAILDTIIYVSLEMLLNFCALHRVKLQNPLSFAWMPATLVSAIELHSFSEYSVLCTEFLKCV